MSGDCRGEVYDRITGESRFGCSCEFTRKPCGYHEGLASGVETALDSTEVSDAFRDAARLRLLEADADARSDKALRHDLAATFDSHLNRGKTYTGAQVAAMLRDGEG